MGKGCRKFWILVFLLVTGHRCRDGGQGSMRSMRPKGMPSLSMVAGRPSKMKRLMRPKRSKICVCVYVWIAGCELLMERQFRWPAHSMASSDRSSRLSVSTLRRSTTRCGRESSKTWK